MPPHSALDSPAPACHFFEFVKPRTEPSSRRVEPKLVPCPAADGSGKQNGHRIEAAKGRHYHGTRVNDFAFDSRSGHNSDVTVQTHFCAGLQCITQSGEPRQHVANCTVEPDERGAGDDVVADV